MIADSPVLATLDEALVRNWPLPAVSGSADKEQRGGILVVAGSREIAGAALLSATAALRAGAGKLVIATAASVATGMALGMPEARVIGLPETPDGGFAAAGLPLLRKIAADCAAAVIGPGLMDPGASAEFTAGLLAMLGHCPVVLDALAMDVVSSLAPLHQPVLLTPHAGEMAHLTASSKQDICADVQAAAARAAQRWNAVVALKGATTVIAAPDGRLWVHHGAEAGLATSGSGDTLAGIIGGLLARGASLEQAGAWGVMLHADAGARLAREAPLGFLARELPAQIPAGLRQLE
ncbi:MAG: NAD(P)H-hydrate dehydratase [Ramlibacter sp.]